MRKYKMPAISVFVLVALGVTLFTGVPNIVKIILIALALGGLVWASWGNHLFQQAAKIIKSKDRSKMNDAIAYLESAIKAGMGDRNTLVAASLVVQYGDKELGAKELMRLSLNKQRDIRCNAKVSLSMYWWSEGDLDRAIELIEECQKENWRHTNFFINGATYYLEKDDEKSFRRMISEAKKANAYSVPLIESESVYELRKGNWKNAGILLTKVFEMKEPVFPDPYIHMAVVYLNYGEVGKALEIMKRGLGSQFSNTSIIDRARLESWISQLENEDTRLDMAEAMAKGIEHMIQREDITYTPTGRKCNLDKLEGYEELPDFHVNDEELPEEMRGYGEQSEEDEPTEADTDLDESDEEWLRKHQDD